MGELGTHVHAPLAPSEHVQVLGERLPPPRQPFGEGRARNVLHTLHQLDERRVRIGTYGGETDTAVAHHHRRDTVRAGRLEQFVPRGLTVEMCVYIDESGGDHPTGGVDDLLRFGVGERGFDGDDHSIGDGDVGDELGSAGAIDDAASRDEQIEHRRNVARPSS